MTTRGQDECVLVVDDEQGIRETLGELVEIAGCSAVLAANGSEALKLLERCRPCLIILDLLMPVMSGNDMVEAMRNDPLLADLPIVISTSAPARAPSGLPVIRKPVDIDVVLGWIRRSCHCSVGPTTSTA
jgi:CheY-like chemotaxis protein